MLSFLQSFFKSLGYEEYFKPIAPSSPRFFTKYCNETQKKITIVIDSNNIIRPFVFDESNEHEPLFVAHLGCSECMRWNRMYGENIAENNEPETDSEDETDYESETSDSELEQDSPNPNLSEALKNCIENFDQTVNEVVTHKDFHKRSQLSRVLTECLGNMKSFLQSENLTADNISTGTCALLNEAAEKLKEMMSSEKILGSAATNLNKDLVKFGEMKIRGGEEEDDDDESYVEGEEEDSSDEESDDEDQEGESSIEPRLPETFNKSEARQSLSSKETPVKDLVNHQKMNISGEHEDSEETENEPRMSDEAEKLMEAKETEESDEDSFDIIERDEELNDDSESREKKELELDVTQEDSEDNE